MVVVVGSAEAAGMTPSEASAIIARADDHRCDGTEPHRATPFPRSWEPTERPHRGRTAVSNDRRIRERNVSAATPVVRCSAAAAPAGHAVRARLRSWRVFDPFLTGEPPDDGLLGGRCGRARLAARRSRSGTSSPRRCAAPPNRSSPTTATIPARAATPRTCTPRASRCAGSARCCERSAPSSSRSGRAPHGPTWAGSRSSSARSAISTCSRCGSPCTPSRTPTRSPSRACTGRSPCSAAT